MKRCWRHKETIAKPCGLDDATCQSFVVHPGLACGDFTLPSPPAAD
jgi:hypothetical protein